MKYLFDEIRYIDILDCNAGDHGYAFAAVILTLEIMAEVSANGRFGVISNNSPKRATNWESLMNG